MGPLVCEGGMKLSNHGQHITIKQLSWTLCHYTTLDLVLDLH